MTPVTIGLTPTSSTIGAKHVVATSPLTRPSEPEFIVHATVWAQQEVLLPRYSSGRPGSESVSTLKLKKKPRKLSLIVIDRLPLSDHKTRSLIPTG
jgi:hypothetical protein